MAQPAQKPAPIYTRISKITTSKSGVTYGTLVDEYGHFLMSMQITKLIETARARGYEIGNLRQIERQLGWE